MKKLILLSLTFSLCLGVMNAYAVICPFCGDDVTPPHVCLVIEQDKQDLQVEISNERANRKRLEEKYNKDKDVTFWDRVKTLFKGTFPLLEQYLSSLPSM